MFEKKSKITVKEFYDRSGELEDKRLFSGTGKLEFERTKNIVKSFLPPVPARILDIGGRTGHYSFWLAELGYEVHLIEPSPELLEKARLASEKQINVQLASCTVGDARSIDFPDSSADVILMFGPLYHLTEKKDRNHTLKEAFRVLNDNGLLFAASISRFASFMDGLAQNFIEDPVFAKIIKQDMKDGQHRNPTENVSYFTDAYFHLPSELKSEIEDAGFKCEQILPVEGLGIFAHRLDEIWENEERRDKL